jgi:lysine/ornithine N-monooxygenase
MNLNPIPKPSGTAEKLWLITESVSAIGIDSRNSYLVGKQSGYNILHKLHHQYSIRTAAIHLERRQKRYTALSRTNTILATSKFLTQYDSYAAAYENEDETRMLTDKGVTEYERVDLGAVVAYQL